MARLSSSALNNEFFTHASQSWKERLAEGTCLFTSMQLYAMLIFKFEVPHIELHVFFRGVYP